MVLKIKEYVQALPRFIDRLTIGRKVETTYDFLTDVKSQLEEFLELRPAGTLPKSLDKFQKAVRGLNRIGKPAKREPLYVIVEALKIAIENKTRITDYIKHEITADVATGAISYKKANILIYVSSLNNVGTLLNDLLWLVAIDETTKNEKDAIDALTKGVYGKLVATLNDYGSEMIKVLGTASEEVISTFNQAPDVVVGDDDSGDALINSATADPMNMGFLPANNKNPFFFVGKLIIQVEDIIYRHRLEMKQLIELRLADLRARDEKAESPALQIEIEKLEDKLAVINYKLDKALGGS